MKKHKGHHSVDRRKRTRAEVTHINKRREVMAKQQAVQQQTQAPTWDDLNGLLGACRELLQKTSPVSQLFVNKELIEAMGDNVTHLRDLATTLNKDVKEYVEALNQIAGQHAGKTGIITDPDELFAMYGVGENYQRWMESFQTVVLPTITDIFLLANSFLPADKQIAQQGG